MEEIRQLGISNQLVNTVVNDNSNQLVNKKKTNWITIDSNSSIDFLNTTTTENVDNSNVRQTRYKLKTNLRQTKDNGY